MNGDRRPVRRQAALVALRWGMAAIVVAAVHFTAAWGRSTGAMPNRRRTLSRPRS